MPSGPASKRSAKQARPHKPALLPRGAARIRVRWRARGRGFGEIAAGGAIDPAGRAAGVVFLLPDGDAGLGFVDDGAAGVEGVAAVRRRHADPDREFAELEKSGAVHAGGAEDRGARRDYLLITVPGIDGRRFS